jgi:hypothetical protein
MSVPGPGTYKADGTFNSTGGKFGTGGRQYLRNIATRNPGPGTYTSVAYKTSGPAFGFGSSKRKGVEDNKLTIANPGPGSYDKGDSLNRSRSKEYSITPRRP